MTETAEQNGVDRNEHEKLRSGVCGACKRPFWWTGIKAGVPHCRGCGHDHLKTDFHATLMWPSLPPRDSLPSDQFRFDRRG